MGNSASRGLFQMNESIKISNTFKNFKAVNIKLSRSEFLVRAYIVSLVILYYSKYQIHITEKRVYQNYQNTIMLNSIKIRKPVN
jgi:hypothetical protein